MIRRANKSDVEEIYQLGSNLHDNYRKVNNLEEMMMEDYTKIFVSIKDNKINGFLSITELYDTVDVVDLYVSEESRNEHVASRLINYMLDDISDTVRMITLEVAVHNDVAIHLYEKFGFEIICKRLFYYGNEDAYLMGRRIER